MRVIAAACAALTVGVIPVFLLGALSEPIGDELGFGTAGTGVLITVFFASAALTAVPMGAITDRVGAGVAMRLGVVISATITLVIGAGAQQWWHLAVLMVLAGVAIGLADTGGARAFSDAIPPHRHGLAFGGKEASIPGAAMLAGLSIPLLAERFGWTWAFVVGAVLAIPVVVLIPGRALAGPSRPVADEGSRSDGQRPASLVVFAIGVACASAASSASATLFVPAVSAGGWSTGAAGVLLAGGSVASIVVRMGLGWWSDLAPHLTRWLLSSALILGVGGAVVLTVTDRGPLVPVGAVCLLGAGWGWTGLAFLRAVRAVPHAPARAAGIVLSGLAGGGAAGPALFGVIASTWSYQTAWAAAATALGVGAVIVTFTRVAPREPSVQSSR
jgi:predicted MFS family arabinose efflux permease